MPRQYPTPYRQNMCQRLLAGEPVAKLSAETGVTEATLFRWKKQALIDAGRLPGIDSVESSQLAAARKRIAELEAEVQLVKDASDLFDATAVVHPKDARPSRKGS
jgi:transposase-like protein